MGGRRFLCTHLQLLHLRAAETTQLGHLDKSSTLRWCIPCGECNLNIATESNTAQLPQGAKVRVRLTIGRYDGIDSLMVVEDTEVLLNASTTTIPVYIPCQGISLSRAHFENNFATNGGALGVTKQRGRHLFVSVFGVRAKRTGAIYVNPIWSYHY